MAWQAGAATADSLRTAIDAVLAKPAYTVTVARDPWAPVRRFWNAMLDALAQLRADNPLGYRVVVGLMIVILVVIVAHAVWIAARTIRAGTVSEARDAIQPTFVPRDALWYAQDAQRLAAEGRYVEAMQSDFLRFVLELDARHLMTFHPSKTPAEYWRESRLSPTAKDEMRALVRELYAHAFARTPADRSAWDAWREKANAERYAAAH